MGANEILQACGGDEKTTRPLLMRIARSHIWTTPVSYLDPGDTGCVMAGLGGAAGRTGRVDFGKRTFLSVKSGVWISCDLSRPSCFPVVHTASPSWKVKVVALYRDGEV